ncbi:MAG TPA: type IV pilus assembly protein PilM, partial [Verrucomicrobiota bacterium]|nr:type IV pilus assembly protein PilM [Verrucomicrobiota bacterium]
MLNTKSFLTVDFGAGSLKLAEFEVNEAGGLRLKQYGLKALGAEGAQESTREAVILKALQEILAEQGIKARKINVSAPGFHVFSKFVKLPPVEAGKVTQMIQYEAQQNVPFPLAEVVWDYQILGTTPGGELEVMLVAIKANVVEGLFRVTETAGLQLQLTDVSPAALCNAFRYNYGDLEDCTMLLDIGAKTSNLLFFEKGKVFSRSINLGANSITQDFANEAKLKFDAAEKLKIDEGFVSLGGAYEEPDNPHQAAISKIARQFMTRLHIQVNQTMQFYRGQQGGSAPQRLFLSGGASVMPYTAQFFAEKLNVPVEYFNPLRNIQLDPGLNLEELARVAHSLGEVVGLGLRNLARCPVELNLMPASTLRWQSFNQKKPYLLATVCSLVAVVAAMGFLFDKLAAVKREVLANVEKDVAPLQQKEREFKSAYGEMQKTRAEVDRVVGWIQDRYYWVDVFGELRQALMRVEQTTKSKLR